MAKARRAMTRKTIQAAPAAPVMMSRMTSQSSSPYSFMAMMQSFSDNAGLILIALSIFIVGFLAGSLWRENDLLKKGGFGTGTGAAAAAQPAAAAAEPAAARQVSMDEIKNLVNKPGSLVFGKKDSKLIFVEFSDPSCPFCHVAAGKNPELNAQMGDRFKLSTDGGTYVAPIPEFKKLVDQGRAAFVWMYSNGHGNGELATQALYCAQEKGRFWEAHDLMMSNAGYELINNTVKNDKANSGKLAEFLAPAVDSAFLKSCLESGKYAARVTEDQQTGQSLGVNGTPGFFVNTSNFAGAYSFKDMEAAITEATK